MFSPNVKVNGINPLVKDLAIEITPNMRVVDFEKIIRSLGLYVQISCRIANRPSPGTSVSNWLLRDIYGIGELKDSNITDKKPFISSKGILL